jgi:hypothetical protein
MLAVSFLASCGQRAPSTQARDGGAVSPASSTSSPSAVAPPAPLPPLDGVPWMTTLELEGGGFAYVAAPLGATSPRPVIVGVHGAGDHADWACSEWRATTRGGAFIVCPRGSKDARWEGALVWGSAAQIARETRRALAALRARFGPHVAGGPAVYGAWSQGATLAGEAIAAAARDVTDAGTSAPLFDRVVLVEGGYGGVNASAMAHAFAASGVRRALVTCASLVCRKLAADLRAAGPRAGIAVETADVGLRGHWFDAPVFEAIGAKLPWLVAGDPRWDGISPPAASP